MRCGIMGPLLRDEFETQLGRADVDVLHGAVPINATDTERIEGAADENKTSARVGLISHIGGHKFAGNVIVYIPPGLKLGDKPHPLAGHGIWYGRVEPKHVEGLVKETVLKGNVVSDLFRGGIDSQRRILRI